MKRSIVTDEISEKRRKIVLAAVEKAKAAEMPFFGVMREYVGGLSDRQIMNEYVKIALAKKGKRTNFKDETINGFNEFLAFDLDKLFAENKKLMNDLWKYLKRGRWNLAWFIRSFATEGEYSSNYMYVRKLSRKPKFIKPEIKDAIERFLSFVGSEDNKKRWLVCKI